MVLTKTTTTDLRNDINIGIFKEWIVMDKSKVHVVHLGDDGPVLQMPKDSPDVARYDLIPPSVMVELANGFEAISKDPVTRAWQTRGLRHSKNFSLILHHMWNWWSNNDYSSLRTVFALVGILLAQGEDSAMNDREK